MDHISGQQTIKGHFDCTVLWKTSYKYVVPLGQLPQIHQWNSQRSDTKMFRITPSLSQLHQTFTLADYCTTLQKSIALKNAWNFYIKTLVRRPLFLVWISFVLKQNFWQVFDNPLIFSCDGQLVNKGFESFRVHYFVRPLIRPSLEKSVILLGQNLDDRKDMFLFYCNYHRELGNNLNWTQFVHDFFLNRKHRVLEYWKIITRNSS